jgi:hypothetical protein
MRLRRPRLPFLPVAAAAVWLSGLALAPAVSAGTRGPIARRDLFVRCNAGETIGRALARLDKSHRQVLRVSGTCRESVLIQGFADLTIVGSPGATLESVPGTAAYLISVTSSQAVSIQNLSFRVTDDVNKPALVLWSCQQCSLYDVTVDGGVGFWMFASSQLLASRFQLTGVGSTGPGVANGKLDMRDSDLDGGGPGGRWCGLQAAENGVAIIHSTTFHGFGTGICVESGGQVHTWPTTTIEDNWCYGAWASKGGYLALHYGTVQNNSSSCWNGGVNVDGASRLVIDHVSVTGNTGGGIVLNHHAFAALGADTVVSGNQGPGLQARNGSMGVAPSSPAETVQVSGNSVDVACDALSHVNNGAQITGALDPTAQCPNFHAGDGPP